LLVKYPAPENDETLENDENPEDEIDQYPTFEIDNEEHERMLELAFPKRIGCCAHAMQNTFLKGARLLLQSPCNY
jgi:hypothetical protein